MAAGVAGGLGEEVLLRDGRGCRCGLGGIGGALSFSLSRTTMWPTSMSVSPLFSPLPLSLPASLSLTYFVFNKA